MVGAITPEDVLIHHFSIGSRASRTAYALPGRMALVYHNITPPEYFIGVHKDLVKLCFRGRRELTAYIARCDLALGDSEYNRQELEALGFPATGVLPVVPDFTHLDVGTGSLAGARVRRRVDQRDVRRPGDPEQEVRGRDPRVPRLSHAPQSALAPAAGRLVQRLRELSHAADALVARLGTPDVHFLGHVSNEELSALYDVADLFLCASEHEGFCVPIVEAFHKRVPVLAYAATAVPATMDGAGVLYDTQGSRRDRQADGRGPERRRARGRDRRVAGRGARAAAGPGLRRHAAALRRSAAAGPPRPAPEVAFDFWAQFDQFERLEELRQYRPALYRALPETGAR